MTRNKMAGQLSLEEFLTYTAKNGYAREGVKKFSEDDGSTTIQVREGDWLAHDNYFTSKDGRRYHGRLVAFLGERSVWFCGYSGFVEQEADPGEVYGFLKKAMLRPEADFPVRGPWRLAEGDFSYEFQKTEGSTLDHFVAGETIHKGEQRIYEANFSGGKID